MEQRVHIWRLQSATVLSAIIPCNLTQESWLAKSQQHRRLGRRTRREESKPIMQRSLESTQIHKKMIRRPCQFLLRFSHLRLHQPSQDTNNIRRENTLCHYMCSMILSVDNWTYPLTSSLGMIELTTITMSKVSKPAPLRHSKVNIS